MKRFLTLFVAAAVLMGLTACEKENNDKTYGELKIADETYVLNGATCSYLPSSSDDSMCYFITLSTNVYWDGEGNFSEDPSLMANCTMVTLYTLCAHTTAIDKIAEGKYVYGDKWGNITHTGASYYLQFDENGAQKEYMDFGQSIVESSQLEVEIKHISGKTYEIKFDGGVDIMGNPVSGYYKGEVEMFESAQP